jgi:ribosomal protein S18 acetylase RimI-like enzyme
MPNIIIRQATNEDAELVADICRRSFFDTYASFNTKENMDEYMEEHLSKDFIMSEVSSSATNFFLAFVEDRAAGYVQLNDKSSPELLKEMDAIEIVRFYAMQEWIGKGIGSALMKICIDRAVSMDKKLIWLIVWQKNFRAIEFYKKWGFEIFDTSIFKLGNDLQDDWVMKKFL